MKHLIRFSLVILFAVLATGISNAQNINVLWFDASLSYTAGSGVSVVINPTDTFTVDNKFTLELSDLGGTWTKPVTIKEVNEFYTPALNGVLPTTLAEGRYKLRIRSSNPEWIEETPSFEVKAGIAPKIPSLTSALLNNSTYFNCQDNNIGGLFFGSLNQQVGAITSSMNVAQRTVKLNDFVATDSYSVVLVDVLNNNQLPLVNQGSVILLPDNLQLGTYVLQVVHTNTTSSVFSSLFLFHGNGTNLGNSSSEEICVNNSVYFGVDTSISGIGRNYNGSKYQVSFGDGSKIVEYTQMQLLRNSLIEHAFTKASCSESGSSFAVQIQLYNKGVANSCSAYAKNGTGVKKSINVSVPPVADFKIPVKSCINKAVFFENITIPGYYGKVGCKDVSNFYWYYKKPGDTNYTLVTEAAWINSSGSLTLPATEVNVAGCWQIKIEAQNQDLCQVITTNEKSIMIESVALASFLASTDSVCVDNIVNFTNTSNVLNQSCSAPVFTWIVEPAKSQNANGFTFISNLNDASIKFTKPGIYAVKLKVVNACGTVMSVAKNIYVAGGASVSLPVDSLSICIAKNNSYLVDFSNSNIKPVYNLNYGKISNYNWIVSGENVTSDDYQFVKGTNSTSEFPSIEFKSAKKYQVKVEVLSDCQKAATDSVYVILNEIPELSLTEKSQTICSGSQFNTITLSTAQNATSYKWTVTKTSNLVTSAVNGSGISIQAETVVNNSDSVGSLVYTIVPTSGLCVGSEFIYTVYVKPTLKVAVAGNGDFCLGATDAQLNLVCKNGVRPYTISYRVNNGPIQQLSTSTTNDTISVNIPTLKTGKQMYTIISIIDSNTATCDNLNGDSIIVEIVDNPIISTQAIAYQVVCKGAEIVPLSVVCAGGAGTQKIQWYKNTTNTNFGGQAIVGANSLTYQPEVFSVKGDFYFYCVITMNASNCGSATSEVAHIQVIDDPVITSYQNRLQVVCKNTILKALQVQALGGSGNFSYQWFVANDTINSAWTKVAGATEATFTPASSMVGTKYYYCEVSQNAQGCSVLSYKFKVEIFETPVISKQPLSQQVCKSELSPVLSVEYTGGSKLVSYQWFTNTTNSNIGGTAITQATEKNLTVSTASAGKFYYYCQLTFGTEGCGIAITNVAEITVTQFPVISNQTVEVVSGQRFTLVPVLKENDILPLGTKYTWALPQLPANSPLSGMTSKSEPQLAVTDVIENHSDTISSVRYTVTPEVEGCAGASFSVNVVVLPALTAVVKKQNITCYDEHNGQLEATIYGGIRFKTANPYKVNWTGPNGFTSSNLRLTNLFAGEYVLSVVDSMGIELINKYIIEQPEKLTITTEKFVEANCSGGNSASIDVKIAGGKGIYNYRWTKNGVDFGTKEDLANLTQGIYVLTVTDENGCVAISENYEIRDFEPLLIETTEQVNNTCFGATNGAISINVKGGTKIQLSETELGYKYNWSGSNNFKSESKDISNLASGEYQLIVTDNAGCTATLSVNITQPTEITIIPFITPVSCFGKNDATITLQVSGGSAPYEVEWSNFATGFYQENVSPGSYTAKVIDANKCEKLIVVKVDEESQFTVYPTVRQITCNGANDGSIKLAIKSNRTGLKVKWVDGSKAGNERNNLAPGVYRVEISDGGPCIITNSFVISEPAKLAIVSKVKNAFGCEASNSGALDIEVFGGTSPYSYLWSNGAKTQDVSNLLPGKYFVTVTDSLGCTINQMFELLRHEPLKIEVTTKVAYCNINLKFKEICTAIVSGGLAPYKYNWSSGEVSADNNAIMESFTSQTVSLEVVDALGCSATYYFKTNIPESYIQTSVVDCNGQVYKFDIQTPPTVFTNVAYNWNFGDGATSNIKSPTHIFLKSGEYSVKLQITSDEAVLNFETTLTVEALPQLKLDREPRFCKNDSVELIVSGAETYIWNDGTRGNRKVIKREGNYTVMGISANGCSSTLAFTAQYYDSQNYSIFTDKNVLTLNDPTLKVWSEDVNLTNYKWEFGDQSTDEGNYANHTYDINSPLTVKVKLNVVNPYGCEETAEKVVWLIMESIPNTFTPNSDGANDRFLKGAKTQIFNSNGIIIYEGTDGWDGTYKGKPVAMDTYYYVVYYSSPEGIVNKPGFVFLAK